MSQKAGQNKAVNHVLRTASPDYQQKAAVYDFLIDELLRDPRVQADRSIVDRLGRASALVRAESTALFEPKLNRVLELYKQSPSLDGISLKEAISAAVGPINTQESQFRLVRGWHGADIHHNVGIGGIAHQTSALPYSQWGTALQKAAEQQPITTQVYNGASPRSGPGHFISHYDPVAGQFYKGEGAGSFDLILPNGNPDDMAAEIVDAARSMDMVSQLGAKADQAEFIPELAKEISEVAGREVQPSELTSSLVSPFGKGASEASLAYSLTTPEMVDIVTTKAYGAPGAEGALNFMQEQSDNKAMSSKDELTARKNAKARATRKLQKMGLPTPSETKADPIAPRPDATQMADQLGVKRYKARFI